MSRSNKLILGTAAFGKPYGIKGDPVPSEREIERIARVAWDGGIRVIHTSWQYELPKIAEMVFSEFEILRKHEGRPFEYYSEHQDGISAYEIEDLKALTGMDFDSVQVPLNVLDMRFLPAIRSGFADHGPFYMGIEVHARSVFLQGLLLMDELPAWVNGQARGKIKLFHCVCRREGYEPYEAALGWVLGLDEIDRVIVGVNSARQLEQLLKVKPLKWDYDFSVTDETILDPRKWPKV